MHSPRENHTTKTLLSPLRKTSRIAFDDSARGGTMGLEDEGAHYHGHRERLRARFLEVGEEGLPDYELLELVLFRSIPRRDVKPLAKPPRRFGRIGKALRRKASAKP